MTDLELRAQEFVSDLAAQGMWEADCDSCGRSSWVDTGKATALAVAFARRVRAEALEAIARHECPLGADVQWCGKHSVYHTTAFDRALAAEAEPAP